jgi:NAD(P)-dependent dehydrogenase (short-subunit alcohol dehydrogenase family)
MKVPEYHEMTAVLTGSSGGIALSAAVALAKAGVPRIMLNGRRPEKAAQAIQAVKNAAPRADVDFFAADVTELDGAMGLIEATRGRFGSIEVLVNSIASTKPPRLFKDTEPSEFTAHFRSNFLSVLNTIHAALPHMTTGGGGTIVSIASDAGKVATPGEAVIGGFKAAIMMFSRGLAMETSRHGVRVHCISPSLVRNTRSYDELMADSFTRRVFEKAEARAKLGLAQPDDLAGLIVYLVGPAAARITGQVISVNGGLTAA